MCKGLALLALIVGAFTFVAFGAQAMPASKLKGASNGSGQITLVAGGCGRGWHRGPQGRLPPKLRNFGCVERVWPGIVRAKAFCLCPDKSKSPIRFKTIQKKGPAEAGPHHHDGSLFKLSCRPASIGTDCKHDGCRGRRRGRALPRPRGLLPPRPALPQRRRSRPRHSNHCDGIRPSDLDANRHRSHRRLELLTRLVPVRVARAAWLGWRQRRRC